MTRAIPKKKPRVPKVIRMMRSALKWGRLTPLNGGAAASFKPNKKRHRKPQKYGPKGRLALKGVAKS